MMNQNGAFLTLESNLALWKAIFQNQKQWE